MGITTTEEVYSDGNRATTIYRDGVPVVIVTMGDGEDPDDYWEQYQAAVALATTEARLDVEVSAEAREAG
jgi:hypothetical protein